MLDEIKLKSRDAEISVYHAARLIEKKGHDALIRQLDDGGDRIAPAMRAAWEWVKKGASSPLSRYQSLDMAAELLSAWAEQTGRTDMPGFYKGASHRLATGTGIYIK